VEDLASYKRCVSSRVASRGFPCVESIRHVLRFDEVHFGGFASKYIRQVFFMDVHPPLAKLLITLAAKVGGFDGNFDFKDIGK
jgi:dolichyl-phosphate-mannose--protein O-mannosyl transferase